VTYVSTVLADNPFHYWRLADPGGQIAHDIGSSPRQLINGSLQAIFAFSGPNSNGGSGFYDSIAESWDLDVETLNNVCSLECWVWQHYRRGVLQDIVCFGTAAGATQAWLRILAAGTCTFFNASTPAVGVTVLTTQRWHHLVGVQTGALSKLYVDGVQDASIAGFIAGTTASVKVIGASDNAGNAANSCSANISEVAYYNYALSAAQVAAHFAAVDAATTTPVYKPFGSADAVTGSPTFTSDVSALLLSDVRRTFPAP